MSMNKLEIMGKSRQELQRMSLDKFALKCYRANPEDAFKNGYNMVFKVTNTKGESDLIPFTIDEMEQLDFEDRALQEYRKNQNNDKETKSVTVVSSVSGVEKEKEFSKAQLIKLDRDDKALQEYHKLTKEDKLETKIAVNNVINGKIQGYTVQEAIDFNKNKMNR